MINTPADEERAMEPCPFCGDKDDFNPSVSPSYQYAEPGNPSAGLLETGSYVECDKCAGLGPNKPSKAEAITAWNARASRPTLPEGMVMVPVEPTEAMLAAYDAAYVINTDEVGGWKEIARLEWAAMLSAAPALSATPAPSETSGVAIPEGMVPWNGGDVPPEDWAGGAIYCRDGATFRTALQASDHRWKRLGWGSDIIAYTPKPSTTATLPETGEVERVRETIRDALMDSQYLAGAKAGWNAAQADDPDAAWATLQKSREGHLSGYKAAKAILAALPLVQEGDRR